MHHRLNVKAKTIQKKTEEKVIDLGVGKDLLVKNRKNPNHRRKK